MLTSVLDAIGHTPLIQLKRASALTGCTILGKAEFMNPGGSVKDRAALAIVQDAVASGALRPGGTIVEGTAGNTGIGLALVANALGYRTVIVIPETQSQEKKDMLRMSGAELVEVPAKPYSDPGNYVRVSERLAQRLAAAEPNGAVWANQFDNVANRGGHEHTTGPEIWEQTDGRVDGFICAVGTGGTLAGVGLALKAKNPTIAIGIADPMGSALFSYYDGGELKASGSSITEGIGQGRITANLVGAPVDFACQIDDREALEIVFDLAENEGTAARRLVRRQCRGRHPAGAAPRPRPHDRDHPVRLRRPLRVEAVQRGFPAREGPADPALAGARRPRLPRHARLRGASQSCVGAVAAAVAPWQATAMLTTSDPVLARPVAGRAAPRISFVSLGCPKALVDSERIITRLRAEGYEITKKHDGADAVVVNTCGFLDSAKAESLAAIGDAMAENGKVIVTGCMGAEPDAIRQHYPNVLAVSGPQAYESVMAAVHEAAEPLHDPFFDLLPPQGIKLTPRHYSYLKIAEGCNNSCSFCIIPRLRGRLVSRPVSDVLREAEKLVKAGVKELLVVSQDTAAYGLDLGYPLQPHGDREVRAKFLDLARELGSLGAWTRLHYIYPYPHVDDVVPLMAEGIVLPYLDIPFQHAAPNVLRAMKRPGKQDRTLDRIAAWRGICAGPRAALDLHRRLPGRDRGGLPDPARLADGSEARARPAPSNTSPSRAHPPKRWASARSLRRSSRSGSTASWHISRRSARGCWRGRWGGACRSSSTRSDRAAPWGARRATRPRSTARCISSTASRCGSATSSAPRSPPPTPTICTARWCSSRSRTVRARPRRRAARQDGTG